MEKEKIIKEIQAHFKTMGGNEKDAYSDNPIVRAMSSNDKVVFALGVDVGDVVDFVSSRITPASTVSEEEIEERFPISKDVLGMTNNHYRQEGAKWALSRQSAIVLPDVRDILIKYTDKIKDYTSESHTIIGYDERDSSEFVDIFLNELNGIK